ncbi:hypothetical protein B8W90_12800, partial [Staphylococcus hominis]
GIAGLPEGPVLLVEGRADLRPRRQDQGAGQRRVDARQPVIERNATHADLIPTVEPGPHRSPACRLRQAGGTGGDRGAEGRIQ